VSSATLCTDLHATTADMSVEVLLESPLAKALNDAIKPKLVEIGWSTGGVDDSALSEYIILMLVNGKSQDQIAAELSGDLLNLGPDDPGARDFSQWLFQQVMELNQAEQNIVAQSETNINGHGGLESTETVQDAEMGGVPEGGEGSVYGTSPAMNLRKQRLTWRRPTGPKSMRNGANRNRDKRMLSHLEKAMDRSHDTALHRVRSHGGNERINSHTRGMPTGPRLAQGRLGRQPVNRPPNMQGMPPKGPTANVMTMSTQQQMELYAMLEQQSRIMAQMFTPQQQMMFANGGQSPMNGGMVNGFPQPYSRSLFDRVQPNPQAQNASNIQKGQNTAGLNTVVQTHVPPPTSAMDVELTPVPEAPSPDTTCKFNLSCTNKDCKFAHQSSAAPPGTAIDVNDICAFGPACKNRKCTGRHPSPAQRIAHQTEQDCKFFPNCTNPRCPFRHPTMPLCRNGADCSTENCKFTHIKTICKFNPCLNPTCVFKHEEGQKRGKFDDKVWVSSDRHHVSERKFVDENNPVEELIVSGSSEASNTTELVT
jgi:nuclear polyadenylated RNA-binding protein NAB2